MYIGYPTIFFSYFYPHFLDGTFDKSNILAINRCIHKGNELKGVAGDRNAHLEGEIAGGRIFHGWASYRK